MKVIKETNGWKLYKGENLNDFTVETPNGFKQYYKFYREEEFDRAVVRGWIWFKVDYYKGHIEDGKVIVTKHDKQIQSDKHDLFLKNYSITKQDVIDKLKPILIKAKDKFKNCEKLLSELQKQFDFEVSYTMLGDTYGIYEDHLDITFEIDGVFCKFRID